MPNTIEVAVPDRYKTIVDSVLARAAENNVEVLLSKDRVIPFNDGSYCNGYFADEPKPKLAVACGQDELKWIQILLHESSHMDQWLENSPYWTQARMCGVETINILQLWIDRHIELTPDQKSKLVRSCRNVELDCERRTSHKIGVLDIGVSVKEYTKRSNGYVLFYNMIGAFRQWYTPGKEPYNMPEIYEVMPDKFYNDEWYEPDVMPRELFTALRKCI